ncbi:methyltransferase [Stappia taiwanensis]|uniref:Methyltransferase n=1 Tax=Stappia taiwanensis TaxID=992267 RepID=A0A838Y4E9_9HYPH|nr:methyltransferase [Stappia taiwanensis]MBA4613833.1 methyltransferase [Stappia taiwanensis]GGE79185.1 hypothetical protein GCM10007285_03750 [Stappia taiwanensis]
MTPNRMRTMADKLQHQIDDKFSDRLSNTPRRQRQAAAAVLDGLHLERTQSALRWLADATEANTLPSCLAGLRSKKAVHELTRARIVRSGGYYDAGVETGEPASESEAARVLWHALADRQRERLEKERIRRALDDARLARIPGYFPTPANLAATVVQVAEIGPRDCVLEPSAGSGALVDAVVSEAPSAPVTAYEIAPRLRAILEMKGHGAALAGSDFMEVTPRQVYDRVIMNPPFENGQDLAHVRRAFEWLMPGGRLVAIMSGNALERSGRRWDEFRAWFESKNGKAELLPAGSFAESGTGVSALLVVVDAPAVAARLVVEPTRSGLQYVLPGCEKVGASAPPAQMDLF